MRDTARALAYFCCFLVLGLVTGALGPALGAFAYQTGASPGDLGVLFAAIGVGNLVGNAVGARLYDQVPGHRVLVPALIVIGTALLAAPSLPALWLLSAAFAVVGVAKSLLDSGGNTLIAWSHGRRAAPYLTALHFCFGAGAFLAPILVGHGIARSGGITSAYRAIAAVAVALGIWLAALPSPAIPAVTATAERDPARGGVVRWFAVLLFLYVGTEVGFGGWIFVYASQHRSSSPEVAGYLTSAFWGALTITRLLATPVVARVRPWRAVLWALLVCLTGAGVVALGATATALWLGTIALGAGMAIVFPMIMVLVRDSIGVSGRTVGRLGIGASLGSMILPWAIGRLSAALGPDVLLGFPFVTLTITLGVLCVLRSGVARIGIGRGHGRTIDMR